MRLPLLLSALVLSASLMTASADNNHKKDRKHKKNYKIENCCGKHHDCHNDYKIGNPNNRVIVARQKVVLSRPTNSIVIRHNNFEYIYSDGYYYREITPSRYEYITPACGIVIGKLPKKAKKVKINGEKVYVFNNVVYRKIKGNKYEVIRILR